SLPRMLSSIRRAMRSHNRAAMMKAPSTPQNRICPSRTAPLTISTENRLVRGAMKSLSARMRERMLAISALVGPPTRYRALSRSPRRYGLAHVRSPVKVLHHEGHAWARRRHHVAALEDLDDLLLVVVPGNHFVAT